VTGPTYSQLVAELFPRLTGGIRWGLDRTRRMLARVGDPQLAFRVLHVGGTNGKGSVAAHLDGVLRQQGRRVGLYTSPHLCSFRERIRIDGEPITERALLDAAARLWPLIIEEDASFFEATTVIAFLAMADAGVEVAAVEVGLGGRLDSTNVVEPDVVVLTNVSLDHVQLLGPAIRDVAVEKAGIIKERVPVVTGERTAVPLDVFRSTAERMSAPLHCVSEADIVDVELSRTGTSFTLRGTGWGDVRLATPLAGRHQAMNAALAVHALDRLGPVRPDLGTLVHGIAATRWTGRLQVERVAGVEWIFDVAHNVAGVEALVAALQSLGVARPLYAVVGVLGDKDWQGVLGPLYGMADRILLTCPPTAPAGRRWDPVRVLMEVPAPSAEIATDFRTALERAYAGAVDGDGSVLVTGSFHTVGDALAALGLCAGGSDHGASRPAFLS
jgi:dihydrofolate synthase / folylpolyglutamate synthase